MRMSTPKRIMTKTMMTSITTKTMTKTMMMNTDNTMNNYYDSSANL